MLPMSLFATISSALRLPIPPKSSPASAGALLAFGGIGALYLGWRLVSVLARDPTVRSALFEWAVILGPVLLWVTLSKVRRAILRSAAIANEEFRMRNRPSEERAYVPLDRADVIFARAEASLSELGGSLKPPPALLG